MPRVLAFVRFPQASLSKIAASPVQACASHAAWPSTSTSKKRSSMPFDLSALRTLSAYLSTATLAAAFACVTLTHSPDASARGGGSKSEGQKQAPESMMAALAKTHVPLSSMSVGRATHRRRGAARRNQRERTDASRIDHETRHYVFRPVDPRAGLSLEDDRVRRRQRGPARRTARQSVHSGHGRPEARNPKN